MVRCVQTLRCGHPEVCKNRASKQAGRAIAGSSAIWEEESREF
jgi:hypothetical protein